MSEAIVLTEKEEAQAYRIADTVMGKLCIGAAKFFKGTGIVLDKGSAVAAGGLRYTADVIETAGKASSGYCYEKADSFKKKADGYAAEEKTLSKLAEKSETVDMDAEIAAMIS